MVRSGLGRSPTPMDKCPASQKPWHPKNKTRHALSLRMPRRFSRQFNHKTKSMPRRHVNQIHNLSVPLQRTTDQFASLSVVSGPLSVAGLVNSPAPLDKCSVPTICCHLSFGFCFFADSTKKLNQCPAAMKNKCLPCPSSVVRCPLRVWSVRWRRWINSLSRQFAVICPLVFVLWFLFFCQFNRRTELMLRRHANQMHRLSVPLPRTRDHGQLTNFKWTVRVLGPSNSQKNMPCHVPRTGWPSRISSDSEAPVRIDLMWAGEFPSACRYADSHGMILFSVMRTSSGTLGSAFSLMVMAAVVWGTKSMAIPWETPLSDMARRTISVISLS